MKVELTFDEIISLKLMTKNRAVNCLKFAKDSTLSDSLRSFERKEFRRAFDLYKKMDKEVRK